MLQTCQENFTTIVYAKFGWQTECIMGNWKIINITPSIRLQRERVKYRQWFLDYDNGESSNEGSDGDAGNSVVSYVSGITLYFIPS